MLFHIILLLIVNLTLATPPACFLQCINTLSHICAKNQADLKCLCKVHEAVNQCIHRFCPAEHFYSARDHFIGTCIEHGLEFQISEYEVGGPLDEASADEFDLDYDTESDLHMFEEDQNRSENIMETSGGKDDTQTSQLSPVGDWSEGETLLDGEDWPEENEIDLSELNQNIVKNYMSYFLKQKPSARPHTGAQHEIFAAQHKPGDTKKHKTRPYIVHGPTEYEPSSKKGIGEKSATSKSRYRKYDGGFDREKYDQILHKRI